ncbi:MAG: sulfatase [Halobacteriaceae archaeon]
MRVLLVDVDSLRPDRLGCYGYRRETAPTIDALAANGVALEECYVSDSPCLPSRTALATGRFGVDTGVVAHHGHGQWYAEPGEGHAPDPDRPLAFRHLSEHGVHTASVSGFADRHLAYHFAAGFRESIQPTAETGGETGPEVTAVATDWLADHAAEEDWLLHVNYWDVHHPYRGVEEFRDQVRESGPAPAWPTDAAVASHQGMTGLRCADRWASPGAADDDAFREAYGEDWPVHVGSRADADPILDGYDAAVRAVDSEIAALLEALESAGVREDTAVVVTADHGEALGEHGIYADHAMAHPPCQRVPMVVDWPGVTDGAAGRLVDGKVYQFDLVATLCDLAGAPVPDGWHAEPLTGALRDPAGFDGRRRLVCGHGIYTYGRAVYDGDWVYTRLLHPGVFALPGQYNDPDLPDGGLELLHDVAADPHLTTNLASDRPGKAAELRADLDDWLTDRLAENGGTDPLVRTAAETGPFLYVTPESLREADGDRHDAFQRAALDRAREFPRSVRPN